ncbi:MAG: hypothetical protein HYS04_16415 [Acidobacteria bacterium]|nr:hypothetical protein [Acidobacteriota bacterium]
MKVLGALIVAVSFLPAQGLWETRAPFPLAATEVSSVALNGKIYSVCGLTADGSSNRLSVYDPLIDSWSDAAPLPIDPGADHCNFAAANGRLYLLGAIRIGTSFIDGNTYEYTPSTNRWEPVARMIVGRGASGVAVIGSKIYVAGGLAAGGTTAAFEVFDTATRRWSALPEMPTARDHLTAQAIAGKFYAIAGRNAGGDLNATEEFDAATNTWSRRAPIPTARGGLASGTIHGRIQVFGGEGNSGTPSRTFRQNEEYDPASNTWRSLAPMPTPRHGLYGATLDNRVFAPSGGPIAGGTFSDVHEVFYLPPAEPPAITADSFRNAASFSPLLAPGAIVSAFGDRLSQGEQMVTALPLPVQMNAVRVSVNGTAVPLFYVGPKQINFHLPESVTGDAATIAISNAGVETSARVSLVSAAPGIFSLNQSGQGQGAILIAGTALVAAAAREGFSRPARRGEPVEIYATGCGRFSGASNPAVAIGNAAAEVLYFGPAPNFAGLCQINARVSAAATSGAAVPVTIQIADRVSNVVTMAVVE